MTMNKVVFKILIYLFLALIGIYHLIPYGNTYGVVLYFVCTYGLILLLIGNSLIPAKLIKIDKIELVILGFYILTRLSYHLALANNDWGLYLSKLESEKWMGIYSFITLGVMLGMQFIYVYEWIKSKKYRT